MTVSMEAKILPKGIEVYYNKKVFDSVVRKVIYLPFKAPEHELNARISVMPKKYHRWIRQVYLLAKLGVIQ